MAKIALPYTIVNGDPVDAGPVESNYQTIENHANQELIERGGTVAMTGQLKLVGNPVAALDAAPKQYVDQMLPIGIITMFGGAAAPLGGVWLACDNTEYEVAMYPELAAILGGAVSGRFRVPNLKDRFPVGSGGAYAANSTGGTADAVVPVHSHTINHAHGNTGDTNTDHIHTVNNHTHRVDLYTSEDGTHVHTVPKANSQGMVVSGTDTSQGIADVTTGGGGYVFATHVSEPQPPTHRHATNGDTGESAPGTGWQDRTAVHAHTTAQFNGSSADSGVSGVGQNMPPYCAVLYVIRAK